MNNIMYAVDKGTGLVYSRVGSEIAFPVLDYDMIGANNDFTAPLGFHLEKMHVFDYPLNHWRALRWTRKVNTLAKNHHRAFWGLPPLKG